MIAKIPGFKNVPFPVYYLQKIMNTSCCLWVCSILVDDSFAINHLFLLKSRNRQEEENACHLGLYREITCKAVKVSFDCLN